jgi:isoleucyl-tRNA synthetase
VIENTREPSCFQCCISKLQAFIDVWIDSSRSGCKPFAQRHVEAEAEVEAVVEGVVEVEAEVVVEGSSEPPILPVSFP